MAAAPEDPAFAIGPPNATLTVAHHQIFAYFAELLRCRRDDASSSDLIGHLMTMQAGSKPLSDSEVIYNSYSLLVGANATTPHTVSGTVLAVAQKPETWETVLLRPALASGLVEEGLRWTSAASSIMRYAIRPTELSGGSIAAGDPIIVWIGSANRDETVFAQPHTFDIARNPNRHIAFGYGPHYCIGAPLARLTICHLFEQLSRRFESIEIVGEPCRLRSVFINGMTHLSIRTRRRSSA
jgi:cytochrome P450